MPNEPPSRRTSLVQSRSCVAASRHVERQNLVFSQRFVLKIIHKNTRARFPSLLHPSISECNPWTDFYWVWERLLERQALTSLFWRLIENWEIWQGRFTQSHFPLGNVFCFVFIYVSVAPIPSETSRMSFAIRIERYKEYARWRDAAVCAQHIISQSLMRFLKGRDNS